MGLKNAFFDIFNLLTINVGTIDWSNTSDSFGGRLQITSIKICNLIRDTRCDKIVISRVFSTLQSSYLFPSNIMNDFF